MQPPTVQCFVALIYSRAPKQSIIIPGVQLVRLKAWLVFFFLMAAWNFVFFFNLNGVKTASEASRMRAKKKPLTLPPPPISPVLQMHLKFNRNASFYLLSFCYLCFKERPPVYPTIATFYFFSFRAWLEGGGGAGITSDTPNWGIAPVNPPLPCLIGFWTLAFYRYFTFQELHPCNSFKITKQIHRQWLIGFAWRFVACISTTAIQRQFSWPWFCLKVKRLLW